VLSLFLWRETDYCCFPVFSVVVTSLRFCHVGSDMITPNWFKHAECSSRDNGKSRVPSPNEKAGIILGGRHRCGRSVTFVIHRCSGRSRQILAVCGIVTFPDAAFPLHDPITNYSGLSMTHPNNLHLPTTADRNCAHKLGQHYTACIVGYLRVLSFNYFLR